MYLSKRNGIYHLYYRTEDGRLKSITTKCKLKSDAIKFVSQFQQNLSDKKDIIKKISFTEFQEFYAQYASSRFSSQYQIFVKNAFKQFRRIINPNSLLNEIKAYHIEKFVQLKLSEANEYIINGYLRTLQGAFQRAIELGYLKENVFKKVKKLKTKSNPPTFPTFDDFNKILLSEKDDILKLIYIVAFYTGMRMGEIRFLKWSSIDFNTNLISVNNHEYFTTKSKLARVIPLHRKLKELLLTHLEVNADNEYVFMKNGIPYTKDFISSRFKRAIRKALVNPRLHFHSLRHGFASNLVLKGVSIYEVSKLLGHSDITTTQIYAHLKNESLINAVELLE